MNGPQNLAGAIAAILTASEVGGSKWQRLVHAGLVEEICRGVISLRSVSEFAPYSPAAMMESVSSEVLSVVDSRYIITHNFDAYRKVSPHIRHIFISCTVQPIT